jgi:hypothetical protein
LELNAHLLLLGQSKIDGYDRYQIIWQEDWLCLPLQVRRFPRGLDLAERVVGPSWLHGRDWLKATAEIAKTSVMSLAIFLLVLATVAVLFVTEVSAKCKCYVPFDEPIQTVVKSPRPHKYLSASELPANFDWRNVNGTNYGSKVLTQQNPAVCGSCWAEAATGALSDRYAIATQGHLRINLAPQQLINFNAR